MEGSNDIEKLFSSKLKNYQVSASDADWQKISSKLGRNNFVKFSLVTFNIYYLSAILLFAGSATYSGVKNYTLTHKVQKLEKAITVYRETGVLPGIEDETVDTADVSQPEMPEPIQSTTNPSLNIRTIVAPTAKTKTENSVKTTIDTLSTAPKADSSHIEKPNIANTDSSRVTVEKKIKKVKKTVFVKPSDVLKRDTVIISKPKK
jgi:hypothetical protein